MKERSKKNCDQQRYLEGLKMSKLFVDKINFRVKKSFGEEREAGTKTCIQDFDV